MKITLYNLSVAVRRVIIAFLIFAVVVVAIDAIGKFFTSEKSPFSPTTSTWQDLPLNAFGTNLTFPDINSLAISKDVIPSFSLRGSFDIFPDTALIYQVSKPREKLDSTDRAKNLAKQLGFDPTKFEQKDNDLTWTNNRRTRQFTHNLVNRTWSLQTVSYFQDENAVQPKTTDKKNPNYAQLIKAILVTMGFTSQSLSDGRIDTVFVKRTADRFQPVSFTEDAEYAVGNAYRRLLSSSVKPENLNQVINAKGEKLKDYYSDVYTDNPDKGSLYIVVADKVSDISKDVYELQFTDFEYTTNTSYYYLISPALAWQGVETGKGRLVSLIPQDKSQFDDYTVAQVDKFIADAEKTELAYYEPPGWTGFVYPIYVFRGIAQLHTGGTASFVFYMDALRR